MIGDTLRSLFAPELVNDPFGDPGLYVTCRFERRALLFDLGDLEAMSARKLLKVSDVFVSHMHMDHFSGFDRLLRICLGREKRLRLFGPPGFITAVGHKLRAYSWNLVRNYQTDFAIDVSELVGPGTLRRATFRCHSGFRFEAKQIHAAPGGILLDEPGFEVRATTLDHGIPCLGFALDEGPHVNIWKNRVEEMGFQVGPWLRELRAAVLRGEPNDTPIRVRWKDDTGEHERNVPLGDLRHKVLTVVPGQTLGYVVDAGPAAVNASRIVALVRSAEHLFIETPFLHRDVAIAERKRHLTARQAGEMARQAGVKRLTPFHFSPRYSGESARLRAEAAAAFRPSS